MTKMVSTFAAFPPLGLVLVVLLGIGLAEYSGMISVALRLFVSRLPRSLNIVSIVFARMISLLAAYAG
jgi:aminobenzoyl-glutamate transport protein